MILTGYDIQRFVDNGFIVIEPYDPKQLNPNSYNVSLHKDLYTYRVPAGELDMAQEHELSLISIPEEGYVLEPGVLYLGRTVEYTESKHCVPMLEGRSSVGRLGLSIHVTAGFGDLGFCGHWTLELSVVQPLRVYANVCVGQICYHTTDLRGAKPYTGKYLNSRNAPPLASKLWRELQP